MRKLLVLTVALVVALAGHAAARPVKTIKVGDDFFVRKGSPPTVSVSKGTRVVFDWAGKSLHNVHARTGPSTFRSSFMRKGSFSRVLERRGTYTVVCDIHGPSMRMTIKVH
jgi:plastocyanin